MLPPVGLCKTINVPPDCIFTFNLLAVILNIASKKAGTPCTWPLTLFIVAFLR